MSCFTIQLVFLQLPAVAAVPPDGGERGRPALPARTDFENTDYGWSDEIDLEQLEQFSAAHSLDLDIHPCIADVVRVMMFSFATTSAPIVCNFEGIQYRHAISSCGVFPTVVSLGFRKCHGSRFTVKRVLWNK